MSELVKVPVTIAVAEKKKVDNLLEREQYSWVTAALLPIILDIQQRLGSGETAEEIINTSQRPFGDASRAITVAGSQLESYIQGDYDIDRTIPPIVYEILRKLD